jgi:hypothetical protein
LAFLDGNAQNLARQGAWYRDGRLVGFHFDDRLILLDDIPDLDQNLKDITRFDAFTQGWKFDISWHIY